MIFNGGHVFGSLTEVKVTCGAGSTIIATPEILANTEGITSYLMFSGTVNEYILATNFASSTEACPLETIEIEPIDGGSQADYTYETSMVSTETAIQDEELKIQIPPITIVEHVYKFRASAIAEGNVIGYTETISITMINCEVDGPLFVDSEKKIKISHYVDATYKPKDIDITVYFDKVNVHCPITKYKVYHLKEKLTGETIESGDYMSIDEDGKLIFKEFKTPIKESYIHIYADSGKQKPSWSSSLKYIGTIEIIPVPINMPPTFEPLLEPATFELTAENTDFELPFPEIIDPEGTKVTLTIDGLPGFASYD
jgi:hypothetical protein